MLKKLLILAFAGLLSPAHASGIVPGFSTSTQYGKLGKIAAGCQLYVIQAGTVSTPQLAYQDSALTIPSPGGSKLLCDATGRLPQFFLADGQIKFRLTDKAGVEIFAQDNLLVVGPSGGGGGGGTVDPTTIFQTGTLMPFYGVGVRSGFVRANGRTIGSSTSGATERANADVQALFEYLWGADANLTVSTGRGASANADWVANKTITLPDFRNRTMAGLGDMGNSDAARLTAGYFGASGTTLGAVGGTESQSLSNANLPNITPSFTGTAATITVASTTSVQGVAGNAGSGASVVYVSGTGALTSQGTYTPAGSISGFGGNIPHAIVQPTILATFYLKL